MGAAFNLEVLQSQRTNGPEMGWVQELYPAMDQLVGYIDDAAVLEELCRSLSVRIRLSLTKDGMKEFKTILLCSLRSLLPKEWQLQHEVAWAWFYDRVSH